MMTDKEKIYKEKMEKNVGLLVYSRLWGLGIVLGESQIFLHEYNVYWFRDGCTFSMHKTSVLNYINYWNEKKNDWP